MDETSEVPKCARRKMKSQPPFFGARIFLELLVLLMGFGVVTSSSSSPQTGILLRVRMADGSMERLQIPPGGENTMSLQEALSPLLSEEDDEELKQHDIQIGSSTVEDLSQSIANLGLKRGSLISLVKKNNKAKPSSKPKRGGYFASSKQKASDRWDPFPDLAKDYESAVLKTKIRRSTKSGMSYGDLANLQSSLHVIEPQEKGLLKRVYMCADSAKRFQANCYKKASNEFECRIGLLLGTVQRERVELKSVARTSLSSKTESSQYCDVVKVHALWEPPTQVSAKRVYDAGALTSISNKDPEFQRVLRIADLLGLRPVGWIFAYNDDRHKEEDSLPVYGTDAKTGSLLQIANMQRIGRIDGPKFVTLSMDATSGATEAFQLSDVCVQMIAEDLWDLSLSSKAKERAKRFVATKHAIIVDGKETHELDSVLCLINTAMLSHVGSFAGPPTNSVKKSGGLTNKVKKTILSSLERKDDTTLFEALCDLNLLVSLDKTIPSTDMEQLCALVRKWARGQKRGTELDEKLKLLLRSILDH